MQRARRRHVPGWLGFAGAVGALISIPLLAGCPGTLEPDVRQMASNEGGGTGSGGTTGNGGNTGTGGTTGAGGNTGTGGTTGTGGGATGGTTGSGGTSSNCTGGNDGATIVMTTCAQSYCHDSSSAVNCGNLDLTVNATIASRLVGVMSTGSLAKNDSFCAGTATEPYLNTGSNPATGLLIDKTTINAMSVCGGQGSRMPLVGSYLTAAQETCFVQWATTLTSP